MNYFKASIIKNLDYILNIYILIYINIIMNTPLCKASNSVAMHKFELSGSKFGYDRRQQLRNQAYNSNSRILDMAPMAAACTMIAVAPVLGVGPLVVAAASTLVAITPMVIEAVSSNDKTDVIKPASVPVIIQANKSNTLMSNMNILNLINQHKNNMYK